MNVCGVFFVIAESASKINLINYDLSYTYNNNNK